MNRFKKSRMVGLASVAMLLSGAVGVGGTTVEAVDPLLRAPLNIYKDAGYLALQIRSNVITVRQYDTTGAPFGTPQQYAINGRCEVVTDTPVSKRLLQLAVSTSTGPGKIGVDSNGMGSKVSTNNSCNRADGRISVSETFTFTIGTDIAALRFDAAELDLEGKFGARLDWMTSNPLNASPVGGLLLSSTSDNGPDSGAGDNTKVVIGSEAVNTDDFTSLTLRALSGEIGVDGGGDGIYPEANRNSKGTFDSIFHLVSAQSFEYTVGCGDTVAADAADNTTNEPSVSDSLVQSIQYVRFPNKGQTACAADLLIGVEIQASQYDILTRLDDVFVNNSSTSADGTLQNVRARLKIVWVVETAGKTAALVEAELARDIDIDPADATLGVPVVYCQNVPAAVSAAPLDPTVTAAIVHPAGAPWCLISDTRVVNGTTIVQTQVYSGNGDPQWR